MGDFVLVLDFLSQSGFDVCGMKIVLLSCGSAKEIELILSSEVEVEVVSGPCLVIILERDNAASCFHLLLKRFVPIIVASYMRNSESNVNFVSQCIAELSWACGEHSQAITPSHCS